MTRWISRRVLPLGLVAMVLLAAACEIAYATIPDSNKVFTACIVKGTGTIRLIDPSLGSTSVLGHCTSLETVISWNQVGQPGPAGPQGPQGVKGDPGAAGKDGVSVASTSLPVGDSTCPQGGAKLVSASGISYVCNGEDGAGVGALTDLNGTACATAYGTGSVAVQVGTPSAAGIADVTLTCDGPGPPTTSSPHDDGLGGYVDRQPCLPRSDESAALRVTDSAAAQRMGQRRRPALSAATPGMPPPR